MDERHERVCRLNHFGGWIHHHGEQLVQSRSWLNRQAQNLNCASLQATSMFLKGIPKYILP